jgi:hypothetical protein
MLKKKKQLRRLTFNEKKYTIPCSGDVSVQAGMNEVYIEGMHIQFRVQTVYKKYTISFPHVIQNIQYRVHKYIQYRVQNMCLYIAVCKVVI